jgi:hypothetical protein
MLIIGYRTALQCAEEEDAHAAWRRSFWGIRQKWTVTKGKERKKKKYKRKKRFTKGVFYGMFLAFYHECVILWRCAQTFEMISNLHLNNGSDLHGLHGNIFVPRLSNADLYNICTFARAHNPAIYYRVGEENFPISKMVSHNSLVCCINWFFLTAW